MVADQAVLSSWRSVVGSLEDDARVSARLMGFVYLAQPQGLIGNTLLLAVPNETTRETLQGTQVADALTDALTKEFREEILLAISIDANLLHSSSEGKVLEDPSVEAPEFVHQRTVAPEDAPDRATIITVDFERGDPVAIDGEALGPAALLTRLNDLGRENGIGRLDLVENRFVGMKSRGVYETPGGAILLVAHRGIESITLDGGAMHLKDALMPRYASLIYNGFWFSPEREMLQAAIDHSQAKVDGTVRLKLYKGGAYVVGRRSPHSLYSEKVVTFEDDQGAYDQRDA